MKKVVPLEGFGGGGIPLNFKIVAYTTEEELLAAQPKENTIGVITEIPITGYKFSSTEPEDMVEGEVWIKTGDDSNVAFDIVEGAKIYPLSVKQYTGGVWVDKTAMSYQSGEWVEWFDYDYLFNYGRQPYTWAPSTMQRDSVDVVMIPTVTINDNGSVLVTFKGSSSAVSAGLYASDDAIDLGGFTALKLMCQNSSGDVVFTIFPENAIYWNTNAVSYTVLSSSSSTEFTIDVSGLSGAYRVGFGTRCSNGQTKTLLLQSIEGV